MNNQDIIQESKSKLAPNYLSAMAPYAITYAIFFFIVLFSHYMGTWALLSDTWGGKIFLIIFAVIIGVILLFGLLTVFGPCEYGMLLFYSRTYKYTPTGSSEFMTGYKKNVINKGIFLFLRRTMLIFLLSLLLFVPGIIYAIDSSQSMFLQRSNQKLTGSDALRESRKLMKGHRMQYFKLHARYTHWYLLSVITLGIGFIFLSPLKNMLKMVFFKRVLINDTEYLTADRPVKINTGTPADKQTSELNEAGGENVVSEITIPLSGTKDAAPINYDGQEYKLEEVTIENFDELKENKKKRITEKLSHPVLSRYDEFDKSSEQLLLEEKLRALIAEEDAFNRIETESLTQSDNEINKEEIMETADSNIREEVAEIVSSNIIDEIIETADVSAVDDKEISPGYSEEFKNEDANVTETVTIKATEDNPDEITTITKTVTENTDENGTTVTTTTTETITEGIPEEKSGTVARNTRLEELLAKRKALYKDKKD